jgi:hypothetical protein
LLIQSKGEAMLLYAKTNDLPEPETFGVNNLLKWLRLKGHPIAGPGKDSWGELLRLDKRPPSLWSQFLRLVRTIFWERESDKVHLGLVVPRKHIEVDRIARWASSEGIPFWERFRGEWASYWKPEPTLPQPSPSTAARHSSSSSASTLLQWISHHGRKLRHRSQDLGWLKEEMEEGPKVFTYRIKRLVAFAHLLITFVGISASLLPIIAIIALSKVSQDKILGFIALFTGLFTFGLLVLTLLGTSRTSMLDIFTASAA